MLPLGLKSKTRQNVRTYMSKYNDNGFPKAASFH